MANNNVEPLIKLAENEVPPILSYNVPQPCSHNINLVTELDVPNHYFKGQPDKKDIIDTINRIKDIDKLRKKDLNSLVDEVKNGMKNGFYDSRLFPNIKISADTLRYEFIKSEDSEKPLTKVISKKPVSERLAKLEPEEVAAMIKNGKTLNIYTNLNGHLDYEYSKMIYADVELPINPNDILMMWFDPETGESVPGNPRIHDDTNDTNEENNAEDDTNDNITPAPLPVIKNLNIEFLRPRLYLLEKCRLSSFLGTYGAGKVLKTFSLLPGEKTKITIKSFVKSHIIEKEACSILDSVEDTSSNDFKTTLETEQTDKSNYEATKSYYLDTEAQASWGFGSAKASAGVKGSTHSAREQFAKNVSSSLSQHANKISSKRNIQINTNKEVNEEDIEETFIEREIDNINLSRTINYTFRQMNQEYISLLHLVDIRIGYLHPTTLGLGEKREVALHELDSLLRECIKDHKDNTEEYREEVRKMIYKKIENIYNWKGNSISIIEKNDEEGYYRIKPKLEGIYKDENNNEIKVKGVILSADKNVLRTDGIVVDAFLGGGECLDNYAKELQDLEIKRREVEVKNKLAEAERMELMNKIIENNDRDRAELLSKLISSCCKKDKNYNGDGSIS